MERSHLLSHNSSDLQGTEAVAEGLLVGLSGPGGTIQGRASHLWFRSRPSSHSFSLRLVIFYLPRELCYWRLVDKPLQNQPGNDENMS